MDALRFAILGLGAGAIYGLSALGIVLVYRGSGVLNFAHGAIGMTSAFTFYDLKDTAGWPIWAALVVAISVAAFIGAATHLLVMRHLRDASGLARLIASLGVLTLLHGIAGEVWSFNYRVPTRILPDGVVELLPDAAIGVDRLILLGIALTLTAVLMVVYRNTKFGLATTAVAENPRATAAQGISPDLIAAVNWAVGGVLAGTAAILIVPVSGLHVTDLTYLVIPALAAALVGGFTSFAWTMAGGLAIGIVESEMSRYVTAPGWSRAVPFIVITLVLVFRGRALPVRGEVTARPPEVGSGRVRVSVLGPIVVISAVLIAFVLTPSWNDALTSTFAVGLIVLSLVVVTGYCGQLSLAQFALAGMGTWIAARSMVNYDIPLELAVPLGVLGAVPIGLIVGLPALRTRGVNLAIVTLGLALALEGLVLLNSERTGGMLGTEIGRTEIFGWDVSAFSHPNRYAFIAFILFVIVSLLVANLRRGRAGRRLIAVRTNERAAAALGVSVMGAKLYAFGLAAAIAALGGILLGFRNPTVVFASFDVFQSIYAVLLAVIGGIGYVIGAFLGGLNAPGGLGARIGMALFDSIENQLRIITPALLLIIIIRDPNGLASLIKKDALAVWHRIRRRPRPPRAPEPLPAVQREPVEPVALTVEHLTVRFGGVVAVDDVSLAVRPGEVVGLIGPNGAGKTTIIDAVTGFVSPSRGVVAVNGEDVSRWSPRRRALAGVGRSFQSLELFESMTVLENLRAASDDRRVSAYITDLVRPGDRPLNGTAIAAVQEFGLEAELERRPDELPLGKRRLVAIARAVAAKPSVLLLDEPAAGLDELETAELGQLIRRLATEWGLAVLVIEHDVSLVLSISDRIEVLQFGRTLASGTPAEIRADQRVIDAYLGRDEEEAAEAAAVAEVTGDGDVALADAPPMPALVTWTSSSDAEPLIEARALVAGYGDLVAVREIDVAVRPGEVVALLGPNGAGKTTTLLTLAGALSKLGGEVRWLGATTTSPLHRRAKEGLALVPEERSVFKSMTAAENLAVGQGPPERALDLFPELRPLLDRRAGLLSGGEQQMLTLARALASSPRVLLVDELSFGLAPLAVERLLQAIRAQADDGLAVLLVEQAAQRAITVADRILVMNRGRVTLDAAASDLRGQSETIFASYLRDRGLISSFSEPNFSSYH